MGRIAYLVQPGELRPEGVRLEAGVQESPKQHVAADAGKAVEVGDAAHLSAPRCADAVRRVESEAVARVPGAVRLLRHQPHAVDLVAGRLVQRQELAVGALEGGVALRLSDDDAKGGRGLLPKARQGARVKGVPEGGQLVAARPDLDVDEPPR